MIVLDHQPYAWFLLQHDGALYLDAHCSHSFFDYSVVIAMNDTEVARYQKEGRDYIDKLAYDIHYSAPAARESKSPYRSRDLTAQIGDLVTAAAVEWRARQSDAFHA